MSDVKKVNLHEHPTLPVFVLMVKKLGSFTVTESDLATLAPIMALAYSESGDGKSMTIKVVDEE